MDIEFTSLQELVLLTFYLPVMLSMLLLLGEAPAEGALPPVAVAVVLEVLEQALIFLLYLKTIQLL
jgi:hypothetical protein